jgi:methylmalonyl-CoA mutase C-terminal domain/subunit
LLDAASLFAQRGYAATTMRDIAGRGHAAGLALLPLPVQGTTAGGRVRSRRARAGRSRAAATAQPARAAEPWARLEAACTAHLETILRDSDYAQVLIRVLPQDVPPVAERLRDTAQPVRNSAGSPGGRAAPAAAHRPGRAAADAAGRAQLEPLLVPAPQGRQTPRGWHASSSGFLRESHHAAERPPKVIVTKIGFDGHDRGSRVVAATLRDAGMEVIYTPPWQEIPSVVKLAMEEDADVIGISSLATDHLIVPRLMDALRAAGLADVRVIVGGIVPAKDEACCWRPACRGLPPRRRPRRHRHHRAPLAARASARPPPGSRRMNAP